MSTVPTTRTERRKAATRRAIIDAAEQIVIERGADALTLEAVSERADVALQTIYNRVGTRSALLVAVAERAQEDNREYMDAAYATPGSPVERVMNAARAYLRFAVERPHQFRILADPPNEPEALQRIAELTIEQNAKLEAALRDAAAEGLIPATVDPALTAKALWAAANGILALGWRADELRADPEEIAALFGALLNLSPVANAIPPIA
ncbi:TetR/AcrR family transcriptional regulator [Skermania sp. ID1734]|uniref:TetR/AcrR family transcriptional regulator n=1 Tax=Skermania sp. ID1734 TaxID=2597516 RepID=UPI00117DFA97|nr:TetR/AcrR family transcriptional regulator [Skermania sp. ID1734]TSE00442.1 TetR/AcrR family transcriptional regulator [Skermania sp. ID1734]